MIDALIQSLRFQLSQKEQQIEARKVHYEYLSLQLPLPRAVLLSSVHFCDSFFLSQPESGLTLLGLDSLLSFKTEGKYRFNKIKHLFSKTLEKWYSDSSDKINSPIAFLAFAFNENDPMNSHWQSFPNTILTIPRVLIREDQLSQSLIVNIKLDKRSYDETFSVIETLLVQLFKQTPVSSEKMPAPAASKPRPTEVQQTPIAQQKWQSLTQKAIKDIQSGQFDKLVTSRQLLLKTSSMTSIPQLVNKLIHYYPGCSILAYHLNEKSIVSASPEQLVSLHFPDIQSKAIGGTIARTLSNRNQTDSKSGANNSGLLSFFLNQSTDASDNDYLEGKKLLKEHHFISQAIYQKLDPLCHSLKMPISPFLMKLHNLYHLETPVQGKLNDSYDLFDVISALHPTPAVAGIPAQAAKHWLLANEAYNRGWYTGAFGWIDSKLDGVLSVLLRCALINQHQVILFSGAGLVAESNPDAEWQETELKMQTIMEML